MGIPGIFTELGPGQRVALSKLAVEKLEETGRPLRLAIDIPIWLFQAQKAQGGSNPVLRTLYYRCLRLLSLSIDPFFVFDGPDKPPFKRNKQTASISNQGQNRLVKQLIKLFGFTYHDAPGEAEAECAMLQRVGVVDGVLSEDIDTLMFGSSLLLRNWSSEGSSANHGATHVSLYDTKLSSNQKPGLDRHGMILVALMSGGDYIPAGIPGCGIKTALEAAKAGFGKTLCAIDRDNREAIATWRSELAHELKTNESKHFRTKHKALKLPDRFPDFQVLGYYAHPAISKDSDVLRLKEGICWNKGVDIPELRTFASRYFEWTGLDGTKKYIRGLAPALLCSTFRRLYQGNTGSKDKQPKGESLIKAICGRRTHFSTDGIQEVRVKYDPLEIVGSELQLEAEDAIVNAQSQRPIVPLSMASDDDYNADICREDDVTAPASPSKRKPLTYDPTKIDVLWIPEAFAKLAVPSMLEDYDNALRLPKSRSETRPVKARQGVIGGMPKGSLDKYFKASKAINSRPLDGLATITSSQSNTFVAVQELSAIQSSSSKVVAKGLGDIRERSETSSFVRGGAKQNSKESRARARSKPDFNEALMSQKPRHPWDAAQRSPNSSKVRRPLKVTKGVPDLELKPGHLDTNATGMNSATSANTESSLSMGSFLNEEEVSGSLQEQPSRSYHKGNDLNSNKLLGLRECEALSSRSCAKEGTTNADEQSSPPAITYQQSAAHEPDLPPLCNLPSPSSHSAKPFMDRDRQGSEIINLVSSSPPQVRVTTKVAESQSNSAEPGKSHVSELSPRSPEYDGTHSDAQADFVPRKKIIMLRDSLPGTWKEVVEPEEPTTRRFDSFGRRREWRLSEVDYVDIEDA